MPSNIGYFDHEPVDAFEFQPGTDPNRVLKFLAENSDGTFSNDEIHEATGMDLASVRRALSHLEGRGLVDQGGRRWTIVDSDDWDPMDTPQSDPDRDRRPSGSPGGG